MNRPERPHGTSTLVGYIIAFRTRLQRFFYRTLQSAKSAAALR